MTFRTLLKVSAALWFFLATTPAFSIMKPESSMLFINEKDGGGTINVENRDPQDALLYVKIIDLADDPEPKLLVTQPVMRVGGGKTQRVRFILNSQHPLTHEHLKRVIFEGINPKTTDNPNTISLNIRHNIPVIIHPKDLPVIADPWRELEWSQTAEGVTVKNSGKYVVRLSQSVLLLPASITGTLDKSYMLPGQMSTIKLKTPPAAGTVQKVRIETLSKYGYETGRVEMPVTH